VQNDLYDVPVGVLWTTIDVVVTVALTALAFVIAGGLRKHEGTERVSTEDGVYRG
jgi:multisubunit Na+/H+ antiporter MnhC subunit